MKTKQLILTILLVINLLMIQTILGKATIDLGIDVLADHQFQPLLNKRIGLLTHPAGVDKKGQPTVDIFKNRKDIQLVALYGPEHGIYGNEKANQPIEDRIDPTTGIPIYSLYGRYRKPTPSMLSNIDIMVIDLQDIGVRSYTYISCMRYTMEACFENNIPVMILDRPNPLGGQKVDGPILENRWKSYVGAFPIPYVHGMTIGEIAIMAKAIPGWLDIEPETRKNGKLFVIPMKGWKRSMTWDQTGLFWIPTSPNIPDLPSVLGYAMTGLGAQLGKFRHGIGTLHPFRFLTHQNVGHQKLYQDLSRFNIPGLHLQPTTLKNGKSGIYLAVQNWKQLQPTAISFYMMQLACNYDDHPFRQASSGQQRLFNKHVGSSTWWSALLKKGSHITVRSFLEQWYQECLLFKKQSQKYWLY